MSGQYQQNIIITCQTAACRVEALAMTAVLHDSAKMLLIHVERVLANNCYMLRVSSLSMLVVLPDGVQAQIKHLNVINIELIQVIKESFQFKLSCESHLNAVTWLLYNLRFFFLVPMAMICQLVFFYWPASKKT